MHLNKNTTKVKKLLGYKEQNSKLKPIYGNDIGLYDHVTSEIYILDDLDWDILSGTKFNLKRKNDLIKSGVIFEGKSPTYKIEAKYDESEMYIKNTEGCNFSCSGCATSSDVIKPSEARTLDQKTLKLFIESFISSSIEKGFEVATIKWAGGEPLLQNSFTEIMNINDFIKLLRNKFPQITIKQIMLTNGVFIDSKKASFLKDNEFHVSISLWGTEKYQDILRKPRSKKETFPIIAKNIGLINDLDISFNVNHVINNINAPTLNEFIEMMWDIKSDSYIGKDWKIKKPIPLSFSIHRPREAYNKKLIKNYYNQLESGVRKAFCEMNRLIDNDIPLQPLYKFDYLNIFETILTSCGTGFSYVAVGPEGVSNCHEGLYNLKSNLKDIEEGKNLFDIANTELNHSPKLLESTNIKFKSDDRIRYHGGQGCPRLAKKENSGNTGFAASTEMLYNSIFDELLALEVKRLLKVKNK